MIPLLSKLATLILHNNDDADLSEIRPARQKLRLIGLLLIGFLFWSMIFPLDIASHSMEL